MKTTTSIQKNILSKLAGALMFIMLIGAGKTANAQCAASFVPYDSVGYGYFMNTSTGTGLTSTWSFGDGTSGTSSGDIIHLYPGPGTYIVCLTISNFAGTCTDTYCDSLLIGSGTTSSCSGGFYYTVDTTGNGVNFYSSVSGTADTYSWDFGDGSPASSVANPFHVYPASGTYTACLYLTSSTDSTCSYTTCNTITISSASSCYAYFMIVQDSTNLFNYFIYDYSSTPGGPATTSYLWDFGDGTTSTLAFPSHTYAVSSPVNVCLTITDGLLCSATYCDSIDPGHASGVFTISVLSLGISEQTNIISSLENYPNPFSDNTTVSYSIKKDASIELNILDLLGNKVASLENENKQAGNYSVNWNSEGVAQGMYLLQLKVNNAVSTKKLIINK
jgi:PKD repeat protein